VVHVAALHLGSAPALVLGLIVAVGWNVALALLRRRASASA